MTFNKIPVQLPPLLPSCSSNNNNNNNNSNNNTDREWVGLVWDPLGVEKLRTQHRIVGTLAGAVPDHSSQNNLHSLPLILMPEEVTLALKNDWIELQSEDGKGRILSKEEEREVWKWPVDERGKETFVVFEDLHSRGFYSTTGLKFGGDFLVYPGDPLKFHAHYVVVVLNLKQPFHGVDLITFARLGVGVKKCAVLASPRTTPLPSSCTSTPSSSSSCSTTTSSSSSSSSSCSTSSPSFNPSSNVLYFTLDWQGTS